MNANMMKFDFLARLEGQFQMVTPDFDDRRVSAILNQGQDEVFLHKYIPQGNKYGTGFEFNEKRRRDLAELVTTIFLSGTNVSGTISYTGNTTSGSNTITNMSTTRGLAENITITGTGIPASTTIVAIENDTTIRISNDATATGTGIALLSGLGKSTSQDEANPTGVIFDLPPLFLYAVQEGVKTSLEPTRFVEVMPITHDYYYSNIDNPFKQPWKNSLWRLDISRKIKGTGLEDGTTDNEASTPKRVELIRPTDQVNITDYFVRYLKYPRRIVVDVKTPANQVSSELDESLHNEIVAAAVRIAVATMRPDQYQIKTAEEQATE